MGKYESEIYGRAEHQFKSVDAMIGWLSSFAGKKGNAYESDAVKVAERLQNISSFEGEIKSAKEYDDLQKIKREINSSPSYLNKYKQELLDEAELKQDKISKELSELTEKRKEERLIEEEKEKEAKRIERREMAIAEKYAKEQERLQSDDKRKRRNAKKHLDKMRERGEI
jgi:hypothetical protein